MGYPEFIEGFKISFLRKKFYKNEKLNQFENVATFMKIM